MPVVDGAHINRYTLQRGSEYVDFSPSAIKSGGNPQVYEQPRIGVRQIGRTPIGTFLPAGLYTLNTIYNIFFTKPTGYDLKFILGILSSKALGWYWLRSFFDQKERFPKIKKDALLSIPIPRIAFSDPANKARHDRMVQLVESMLALHKQLAEARSEAQKGVIQRQIDATDAEIDRLVYDLYGLTAEEVAIVKGKKAPKVERESPILELPIAAEPEALYRTKSNYHNSR